MKLPKVCFTTFLIKGIDKLPVKSYGIWNIFITIIDSKETKRSFIRPYITIDRDLRFKRSPILLLIIIITDLRIYLVTYLR